MQMYIRKIKLPVLNDLPQLFSLFQSIEVSKQKFCYFAE